MGLTDKEYIWVVSQSIVGDISDDPAAPEEFPVGVLGKNEMMMNIQLDSK